MAKIKSVKDTIADEETYETMSYGVEDIVGLPRKTLAIIQREYNPKELKNKILRAQKFRKEHHLIQPLVNTTLEFCSAGFHVEYGIVGPIKKFIELFKKKENRTSEIKKYYDDFNRKWNMDKKVIKMLDSLITTNNCVIIGSIDLESGELKSLKVVNPATVEIINAFDGKNMLLLELDEDFVKMVNDPNGYFQNKLNAKEIKDVLDNIPQKYIDAVKSGGRGTKKVLLKEEDGDFWLLRTKREQEEDGLEEPDMCAIFETLATYDLLDEADQIAAFIQKALIVLISQGETLVGKTPTEQKAGWLSKEQKRELESIFKKPIKGLYVFGAHNTKVQFIYPPPEIFSDTKYEATRRKIMLWKGISFALMEGSGGSYAVAWINLRKFLAEIQYYRRLVSRLLEELWSHPVIKPGIMQEEDALPKARFDEQITEEPRTLLAKVQFGLQQGILSIKTALETLGFRPRNERLNKLDEMQESPLWSRVYEPNQGLTPTSDIKPYLFDEDTTDEVSPPAEKKKPTKKVSAGAGRPISQSGDKEVQSPRPSTT